MTTSTSQSLQAFAFDSNAVRVVTIDGQPWFVARDVCNALTIENNRDALSRLDDDEKDVATTDTLGGEQELSIVSESGLYSLILTSRKPEARRFKKWVTSEVLPSIRKTGQYTVSGLDGASLGAKMDRLFDMMEQVLKVLPKMVEAINPARGKPGRKRMYAEDAERILALRDKGYKLDDLVIETEFSLTQCWSIMEGRYKVLESGRVSIDGRSDAARAADAAAKAERSSETGSAA